MFSVESFTNDDRESTLFIDIPMFIMQSMGTLSAVIVIKQEKRSERIVRLY